MKFACIADLHGNLPQLDHLDFDVLLIAGDICPVADHSEQYQAHWLNTKFRRWLDRIDRPVIAVAGNHDFLFERRTEIIPDLPWTYLKDSGTTLPNGLRVWGSPWQPYFGGWAFNLHQDDFIDELAEKWDMIPAGTDILLLHGPPGGHGDYINGHGHVGSASLTAKILEIQPAVAVFGHIHSGYGRHDIGRTIGLNVAHVDERYRAVNPPVLVEVDDVTKEWRVIA